MSDQLFFSGRNLQQALLAASRHFGLPPERIAYRDRTRKHGVIKTANVVIQVDPLEPELTDVVLPPPSLALAPLAPIAPRTPMPPQGPSAPTPEAQRVPSRPAQAHGGGRDRGPRTERASAPTPRPVVQVSESELSAAAATGLGELLRLAGLELVPEIELRDERVQVDLGAGALGSSRERGEILRALEVLLPRVIRGLVGVAPICRVDAGGDRRKREAELEKLALEIAAQALAEGRAVEMPPLESRERRAVHMALRDRVDVVSESVGEGATRRVVIRPA